MSRPITDRKQMEEILIRKAAEDDQFRERLKADPKAVITAEFDVRFPEPFSIQVVEESDAALYLVLPARPMRQDDRELSDAELNAVAGGIIYGGNMEKAKAPAPQTSPDLISSPLIKPKGF